MKKKIYIIVLRINKFNTMKNVSKFLRNSKGNCLLNSKPTIGLTRLLCRRLANGHQESLRQHKKLRKHLKARFLAVVFARTHTYNFWLAKQLLANGMCDLMLRKLETLVHYGYTPAIAFLAWILHHGVDGVKPDPMKRLTLLQNGMAKGCSDCLGEMAYRIYCQRNPGDTLNECREMAEKSAQEDSIYGIYALSCITEPDYGKENAKTDQALSHQMLMLAAKQSHPDALSKIALASNHGWRGLPRDESLACELYRRAAQGGEIGSFVNCGILESESGNHDAAIWWLERAVKTGNLYAEANLKQVRDAAETRKRQKM